MYRYGQRIKGGRISGEEGGGGRWGVAVMRAGSDERRINSRMPYCIREGNAKVLKTTDSIEKLGFLNHESGFDKRMFYVTNKKRRPGMVFLLFIIV